MRDLLAKNCPVCEDWQQACSTRQNCWEEARVTWFDLWERPSCCMALSADQGSSMVRWTRLRWLATSAEACRDMPVDAASETMATSFLPFMKRAAESMLSEQGRGLGVFEVLYLHVIVACMLASKYARQLTVMSFGIISYDSLVWYCKSFILITVFF